MEDVLDVDMASVPVSSLDVSDALCLGIVSSVWQAVILDSRRDIKTSNILSVENGAMIDLAWMERKEW